MKKTYFIKIALLALIIIGIISCGGTKKKLAHKWMVSYAMIYDSKNADNTDEKYRQDQMQMESFYKGQVYDLRPDGTFTIKGNVDNFEGKWETRDNRVEFTGNDGKLVLWVSLGNKLEIGHDSCLTVRLGVSTDDYTQLTLKPAPGETVKTDY